MSAKVLVVMRTKNRPLFLDRAIRSVVAQTYKNWHCVIVNDGGDAKSVENVLASVEKNLSDSFSVVHNLNSLGMEAASNKGLAVMSAEYYAIHDDDDSWAPKFLEETVHYLESCVDPSVQGVVARTVKVTEVVKDGKILRLKESLYNPEIKSFTLPRVVQNNPFVPIAFVYSKKALAALSGYDESLPVVGDWDFNIRFLQEFDIGFLPGATAYYHVRKDSLGSVANSINDEVKHQHYRAIVINRMLRRDLRSGGLTMGHVVISAETGFWANRLGEKAAAFYYMAGRFFSRIRSFFSLPSLKK